MTEFMHGRKVPLISIQTLSAIGGRGPRRALPDWAKTWCECCNKKIDHYWNYYTVHVCGDCRGAELEISKVTTNEV